MMILLISACANTVNRGHLKEDEAISSIKEGVTTKAEVVKGLGSPSSESSFGNPTWFYVSSIRQTRSVFAPEVVDQHVIEIAFDSNNVVTSLKQYSLKDGKNVEIASRVTPTEGQHLGVFEQMLSNLGRFNKDTTDSTSNSHSHGNTNPSGAGGYPR